MPRKTGDLNIPIERIREAMPELIALVQRGASPELVAGTIGIHRVTWWRWRDLARREVEPYHSLMDELLRAEAVHLVMTEIGMVADSKLLPGAWILERRRPELFSLIDKFRPADEDAKQDAKQTDAQRLRALADRFDASGAAPVRDEALVVHVGEEE